MQQTSVHRWGVSNQRKLSAESIYPVVYVVPTESYPEDEISLLETYLSDEERTKSRRYRFIRDRDSFIITHALLRQRLSEITGEKPEKISIDRNFFGKPFVTDHRNICFNLSHCHKVSVIAIDMSGDIGADVEEINSGFEFRYITERYFSDKEQEMLRNANGDERILFYKLWTKKEAFLKGLGIGLSEDNLEADVSSPVLYTPGNFSISPRPTRFRLKTFLYLNRYVITIAVSSDTGKAEVFMPYEKLTLNI